MEKWLLLQQLLDPDPSHKRSTPGNGIPTGGVAPLFISTLLCILVPSGLGSISAKASGGKPAIAPNSKVLTVAMPTKLLSLILLSFTVTLSTPTTSIPEPCLLYTSPSPRDS